MTTTFILIRHGETDWNVQHRMQGNTDIPLNSKGKNQAKKIANQLRKYPIHVFYCSPLKRASLTARIIHANHADIPIFRHNGLRERNFGLAEGKTYDEISKKYPVLSFDRSWHYPQFQTPQGERLIDVYQRGNIFIDEVLKKEKGKTIAIVSHGVIIRCMISSLLNLPLTSNNFYELGNTSMTIIRKPENKAAELHVINYNPT